MARYKSLRDLLARLLPGRKVEVQTYTTVGIRGSHDPVRWYAQLRLGRFEISAARAERLMQKMVTQALTELANIYSIRYEALQQAQHT